MNLARYLDNEKIATLARALRSGDAQWIADAANVAREEPRLERVVDAMLASRPKPGQDVPLDIPAVSPPLDEEPAGSKGGEAGTEATLAAENPARRR